MNKVGAVILAAGRSCRFGAMDKRLARLSDGKPLLQTCIDVCAEAIEDFVVVLGKSDTEYADLLDYRTGKPVFMNLTGLGMGDSLARGVQAMVDCDAIMVLLGDMPFVKVKTLQYIVKLSKPNSIIVPTYLGATGHPVLFAQEFFPSLVKLKGDIGAKIILRRHESRCQYYECDDRGILMDIDTEGQLEVYHG